MNLSLPVIAVVFIILWLVCLFVYLRLSSRQEQLADDIQALRAQLDSGNEDGSP